MSDADLSRREKLRAILRVAAFKPRLTVAIIVFSFVAALLEGIGLSFLIPVIEVAQSSEGAAQSDAQFVQAFMLVYETLNVPFTLGTIIFGLAVVMVVRYTASFIVSWQSVALRTYYVRELQTTAFDNALDARIAYFDEEGSDDILNAIVTQAEQAGLVIRDVVKLLEYSVLAFVYLSIAFILSPVLTILTAVVLGGLTLFIRYVLEPGYAIGDRVADANEGIQRAVQAGTQGIRDVKVYGMRDELYERFSEAIETYTHSNIALGRNEAAIDNFYNLSAAVVVFALVYLALRFAGLSLAGLGVFLFAMFRLAPYVSSINNRWYKVEGRLAHLIRTQQFTQELQRQSEPTEGVEPVPDSVDRIEFDNVSFAYDDERVLQDVGLHVDRGEFVALVGQSGAGKSTITKLLARMYEVENGQILANGRPITRMDLQEWRAQIAVVRQDPFIFNETLRRNVTIGNREASNDAIKRVCEIAHVSEFLDDLPDGLDTKLGDEGVRLSGGQRQRVSLARALLKDADVLVLDEATSDLDTNIEQSVQRAIESMERDYAIVAIAHRLSTVVNADRIYTLEDGQVTESGTHEDLITNDGKYAELYAVQ